MEGGAWAKGEGEPVWDDNGEKNIVTTEKRIRGLNEQSEGMSEGS